MNSCHSPKSGSVAFMHQEKTNGWPLIHYRIFLTLPRNVGKLLGSLYKPAFTASELKQDRILLREPDLLLVSCGKGGFKATIPFLCYRFSVSVLRAKGWEPATLCLSVFNSLTFLRPVFPPSTVWNWIHSSASHAKRDAFGSALFDLSEVRAVDDPLFSLLPWLDACCHWLILDWSLILASLRDSACLSLTLCLVWHGFLTQRKDASSSVESTVNQLFLPTSAHPPELQCSISNWLFLIVCPVSSPWVRELGWLASTFP